MTILVPPAVLVDIIKEEAEVFRLVYLHLHRLLLRAVVAIPPPLVLPPKSKRHHLLVM